MNPCVSSTPFWTENCRATIREKRRDLATNMNIVKWFQTAMSQSLGPEQKRGFLGPSYVGTMSCELEPLEVPAAHQEKWMQYTLPWERQSPCPTACKIGRTISNRDRRFGREEIKIVRMPMTPWTFPHLGTTMPHKMEPDLTCPEFSTMAKLTLLRCGLSQLDTNGRRWGHRKDLLHLWKNGPRSGGGHLT